MLAWHVNAGPPFVGIDAHTSGVTDGLQNVYSLCEGSHVSVWHPTLKYTPFASSVPQHTPPPVHWDESEHGSETSFPFWQALEELVSHECVILPPPPPPPPPLALRQQTWLPVVQ